MKGEFGNIRVLLQEAHVRAERRKAIRHWLGVGLCALAIVLGAILLAVLP